MTRSFDFYKEDIEPTELDDHIWRMELDMEIERELKEWNKKQKLKPTKITIGRYRNRVRNRKFENYGTKITVRRRGFEEPLPF